MRAVVIGALNLDVVVNVPRLPLPGESLPASAWDLVPGGKGGNQAVAVRRLGGDVVMVARVGADEFGARLRRSLQSEGVDDAGVREDPVAPTGVAIIAVATGGENSIAVVAGANGRVTPEDVVAAAPLFTGARMLLVQFEIPMDAVEMAMVVARQRGMRVLLDPSPVPPAGVPDRVLAGADLVLPNAVEAAALTGVCVDDPESAERAGRILLHRGAGAAVVKRGRAGAVIVTAETAIHVPGFRVASVDATAAGDAFAGGVAVALMRGEDLRAAVRFASAAGALSTTHPGAQPSMPTGDEVMRFLAGVTAAGSGA